MPAVKDVGEPGAGEPHARFDEAAGGIWHQSGSHTPHGAGASRRPYLDCDAACLDYLAVSRWPEGFRCPACGSERAWILERRHLWECSDCHHQPSVTAGTVMHGTHTPLRLWFWAAYLVATHTPGISALQLQRQLGISRYETRG
jgi:Transposase zinc-ribbon domain